MPRALRVTPDARNVAAEEALLREIKEAAAQCGVPLLDFGELRLQQMLGDGTFSVVYCADHRGRTVAVKLFNRVDSAETLRLFLREVQTLGRSNAVPQGVTKLEGYCVEPLALVLEYVDGFTLFDLLHSKDWHFTWRSLAHVALELASAMEQVHRNGILHRDIKSLNVLINRRFGVKLCDFGLGRLDSSPGAPTGGRGTPQYMAPEVALRQAYDEKADIYSYGITLWEMAARAIPFADTEQQIFMRGVAFHAERPRIPTTWPAAFANLIRCCWAQDPRQRPTARALVAQWSRPESIVPAALLDSAIVAIQDEDNVVVSESTWPAPRRIAEESPSVGDDMDDGHHHSALSAACAAPKHESGDECGAAGAAFAALTVQRRSSVRSSRSNSNNSGTDARAAAADGKRTEPAPSRVT